MDKNKYGVPFHEYSIVLPNGTERTIDIGCEEDWGDIQEAYDSDGEMFVGVGNDRYGHARIVKVYDYASGEVWIGDEEVKRWAKDFVWKYVANYSS